MKYASKSGGVWEKAQEVVANKNIKLNLNNLYNAEISLEFSYFMKHRVHGGNTEHTERSP